MEEYPQLLEHCNRIIENFIGDDRNRHKEVVPSLGEFLALLTASKFSWDQAAVAYLQETLARNVLWTMKRSDRRYGDTHCTDVAVESTRVQAFWESNVVSWRLLAFHVYFLQHIARPRGLSLQQVAANYDARLGQPSEELKEEFQASIKEIPQRLVKTWAGSNFDEFFRRINVPVPSAEDLHAMIKRAVEDAHRKGALYTSMGPSGSPRPQGRAGDNGPHQAQGRARGNGYTSRGRGRGGYS